MRRRDFIKYAGGGVAALIVGTILPSWLSNKPSIASSARLVPELKFTITDGLKDMVTHNSINTAQCYFWLYKEENFSAEILVLLFLQLKEVL